jgi:uncharacterized protein (DUF924 family)
MCLAYMHACMHAHLTLGPCSWPQFSMMFLHRDDVQAKGAHKTLPVGHRVWLFLPFMHSEVLADQERCVELYKELSAEEGLPEPLLKFISHSIQYAEAHRDVVARWGRFPHRNAIVGRESTSEEAQGLAEGTIAKF